MRIFSVTIILFLLMDGTHPRWVRAEASGCTGCPTNSPIVNTFPFRGLRWGTAVVLDGTVNCPIKGSHYIAIAEIPPSGGLRGYQLIVVDGNGVQKCAGVQLVGIKFRISRGWEPYVIQQIAKTTLREDLNQINRKKLAEDRLMYYIAAAADPDESVCVNNRMSSNRFYKRWWRRAFNTTGPSFRDYPPPELSASANDVSSVPESVLEKFAVLIPNAAYTEDGVPVNPEDYWGQLPPVPPHAKKLEWFELACAGGALADTELYGLVEPGDDKKVRTAALRMFLAKYEDEHDTVAGVPIEYVKHKQGDPLPPGGKIEAQWDETGALCISHSRMWLKNILVTEGIYYRGKTLRESEITFVKEFTKLKPCGNMPRGYFTSYVTKEHITD